MAVPLIWLIAALALAGAEALTGDLFLLMLGGGALAAAGSSLVFDDLWIHGAVFLVVSVLLLALVGPVLRRHLTSGEGMPEPAKALEGKSALVLDRVARHEGQVKVDGEIWTARPATDDEVYEPGDHVTVVYFQVTNQQAAVYQISNYIVGVEQLTTTTLRNVVGGMTLEQTLTSRDQINGQLRGVLDEATGRWGLRVARVELRSIDPPPSIQDSMEKQMRADREKRAMILTAEGSREAAIKQAEGQEQAQILSAEGAKQAAILAAEADRQPRILPPQGERAAPYLQAHGHAKAVEQASTP